MTKIKGTAGYRFTLEWDGPEERLIEIADALSLEYLGEGLDSLDLGDALGAMGAVVIQMGNEEYYMHTSDGYSLSAHFTLADDICFNWEGIKR